VISEGRGPTEITGSPISSIVDSYLVNFSTHVQVTRAILINTHPELIDDGE